MCGEAVLEESDGTVLFKGTWENNEPHGECYQVMDEGIYAGVYDMGLRHGLGRMDYNEGNVYEGEWVNDVRQGMGRMEYKDDGSIFTGSWKSNAWDNGELLLKDGRRKLVVQGAVIREN